MRIFVYGSIVYDRIMDFPDSFKKYILPNEIHKLNVSFMINDLKESFGGTGGNIAYNLTLLGFKPLLYGSVGKDFERYEKHFKNIDLKGVKQYLKDYTASAYIITDKDNNQITGFHPGAMRYHTYVPKLKKSDLVIISPANPNEMLDLAEKCFKEHVPFIFDPGQQIIQFTSTQLKRVIKQATIYIVNDYELALTCKLTNYNQDIILQKAGILITTFGQKGSVFKVRNGNKYTIFNISSVKVNKVVDPTGAGDAFRAGLIKGILENKKDFFKKEFTKMDWLKIGQLASLTATYSLENEGTQNHKYTINQLKNRYYTNYKIKL